MILFYLATTMNRSRRLFTPNVRTKSTNLYYDLSRATLQKGQEYLTLSQIHATFATRVDTITRIGHGSTELLASDVLNISKTLLAIK
jgi:hypothetical protein